MKIAIPTNDQRSISKHFGRSKGFLIVEVQDNEIKNKVYTTNTMTTHALSGVQLPDAEHHHAHNHHHGHGEHNHSHEGIFKALGNCDTVIAGGMGRRLYQDFADRNTQVFVTKESDIDKAIELYLSNRLDNNTDQCCEH